MCLEKTIFDDLYLKLNKKQEKHQNICKIAIIVQQTFVSLEHVLKTSSTHVLKTSWRHVLKMSRTHLLKTSWRHYGEKQSTYWGYLYLTNLNVYLTNLYLTNLHLTILKRVQNALSRTRQFNICLILELKQHLYFKN